MDLSSLAGVASRHQEHDVLFTPEPDAWLHRSFNDSQSLQQNASHPSWLRLSDEKPLLRGDLGFPFTVHGAASHVALPAKPGHPAAESPAKATGQVYQDNQIAQGARQLEISGFSLSDITRQLPPDASPAYVFSFVTGIEPMPEKKTKASLDRRQFLRWPTIPKPVGHAAALVLVAAVGAFAADGTNTHNAILVETLALIMAYYVIKYSWFAVKTVWAIGFDWWNQIERRIAYTFSEPPGPRQFQEASAPLPEEPEKYSEQVDLNRRALIGGDDYTPLNSTQLRELYNEDTKSGLLYKLTPEEASVDWQPGWHGLKAWFSNVSLTVPQRMFGWILAVLDIKTRFSVKPHRIIYRNYGTFNVSLWSSWINYHRFKHDSQLDRAQNKLYHYLSLAAYAGVGVTALYFSHPATLAVLRFVMKIAQPFTPWLEHYNDPISSFIITFFVIGLIGRGIFLFYGEGGPLYWWGLKFLAYFIAALPPGSYEKDFYAKANQDIEDVYRFVDSGVLDENHNGGARTNYSTFLHHIDSLGAELGSGLLNAYSRSISDVQQNLADAFYEYDRQVRSGQISSLSLAHIGLDLPVFDESEDLTRRAELRRQAVGEMLSNGRNPRGVLLAIVATNHTDLALDGLDRFRAAELENVLKAMPARFASLAPGSFELYSESFREHQQLKDISACIRAIQASDSEINTLRNKFVELFKGERDMQGIVELIFDPRGIPIQDVVRNTFVFMALRRWQKTDPTGMRKVINKLQEQQKQGKRRAVYLQDVFLRGSQGVAVLTGARLEMGQRHGDELLEGLDHFGIPLTSRSHKRGIYFSQEMFTNPRSAVQTLARLTRVARVNVIVTSATKIMDGFILLLKERIPWRLKIRIGRRLIPLYFSQFDFKKIPRAPAGQEPILATSLEPQSIKQYLQWHDSIRILAAAPHLSTLAILLVFVRREPEWLKSAFAAKRSELERSLHHGSRTGEGTLLGWIDHEIRSSNSMMVAAYDAVTDYFTLGRMEQDRQKREELHRLDWLEANLMGKDGLAIGDYLEKVIGTPWSEQVDDTTLAHHANIPNLPPRDANGDWTPEQKKEIETSLQNIGQWHTNIIISPAVPPLREQPAYIRHQKRMQRQGLVAA
jgi:hypothetical protein